MKNSIVLMVVAAALAACGEPGKSGKETTPVAGNKPPASNHPATFNAYFEQLLGAYYGLKDALVAYDTAAADAAARQLAAKASNSLNGDTAGITGLPAKTYLHTLMVVARGVPAAPDLDKKKMAFKVISDALYQLVRTVDYDGQKVYRQHCPMAFNGQDEAWWLSNSSTIVNPYLGRKHPKYKAGMAGCGDVTDSLGYSR